MGNFANINIFTLSVSTWDHMEIQIPFKLE